MNERAPEELRGMTGSAVKRKTDSEIRAWMKLELQALMQVEDVEIVVEHLLAVLLNPPDDTRQVATQRKAERKGNVKAICLNKKMSGNARPSASMNERAPEELRGMTGSAVKRKTDSEIRAWMKLELQALMQVEDVEIVVEHLLAVLLNPPDDTRQVATQRKAERKGNVKAICLNKKMSGNARPSASMNERAPESRPHPPHLPAAISHLAAVAEAARPFLHERAFAFAVQLFSFSMPSEVSTEVIHYNGTLSDHGTVSQAPHHVRRGINAEVNVIELSDSSQDDSDGQAGIDDFQSD
eukprot:TRINITY_DN64559_c0_g1_i1.p1 TRINITY_DN64559_c0_g1~~TRINITY_DN64559_c0_g1_i1.p1  ORF type:complete len:297 (-),score=27.72 TRINITY_DN64559_c0_g1_i1:31-921(-)